MIYISDHNVNAVTVNGTTDTAFVFTNNQTHETYSVDLWAVGINPLGRRRQLTFLLQWIDADTDTGAGVENGVNIIRVPRGEYDYSLGSVKGLMKLVDGEGGTTYETQDKNIVYNG